MSRRRFFCRDWRKNFRYVFGSKKWRRAAGKRKLKSRVPPNDSGRFGSRSRRIAQARELDRMKICHFLWEKFSLQGKRWGRVEWSHELNQQDLQARVAAGILFVYANSSSVFVRSKTHAG